MKSRLRFFLSVSLGSALLEHAALRADIAELPPVAPSTEEPGQLKPVAVSTVFVSIRLRPFYRDSGSGPRLSRLMIEEVRARSLAERAGLLAGMELLAIQGTSVAGLRDIDLEKLCEQPVIGDTLLLKIGDAPIVHGSVVVPRDIRVPLTKMAADKAKELATTGEPKKRRSPGNQK